MCPTCNCVLDDLGIILMCHIKLVALLKCPIIYDLQVAHSNPYQPLLSLLKRIRYPETHNFSSQATQYGYKSEEEAKNQ